MLDLGNVIDIVHNLNFLDMGNPSGNPDDRPELYALKVYIEIMKAGRSKKLAVFPEEFMVGPLRFVVEEERLVVRYHFAPYRNGWMEVEGQEMMMSCTTRGHEPDELYEGDEGTHVLSSCHAYGDFQPGVSYTACINFYPENVSQLLALLESPQLREILEHESPMHAWLMIKYPETRGGES